MGHVVSAERHVLVSPHLYRMLGGKQLDVVGRPATNRDRLPWEQNHECREATHHS